MILNKNIRIKRAGKITKIATIVILIMKGISEITRTKVIKVTL
jgi:hypothetical protein